MEIAKYKDQYKVLYEDNYFDDTYKNVKRLKHSSGELEEIDLTSIVRRLK